MFAGLCGLPLPCLLGGFISLGPRPMVGGVGYPSLIRTKQVEAVKQYASFLFPAPDFIGLLMDLGVTKTALCHLSEFMTRRGIDYTASTCHTFPLPVHVQGYG